ncbi:MAG: metalloregulator ArsR/SmtB family transcription factor [Candidatus Eisenbacteria bacterium]|nr:metalloregulator ArsR/SmtB family transcription factor [Candidatus Eisenbacteria bacterium]
MKSQTDMERLAGTFKALSDPTRLRIVKMLRDAGGPLCVNAIAYRLEVTQSAVSQHLRILRQAGIVEGRRAGRRVHYSVDTEVLKEHERLFKNALKVK